MQCTYEIFCFFVDIYYSGSSFVLKTRNTLLYSPLISHDVLLSFVALSPGQEHQPCVAVMFRNGLSVNSRPDNFIIVK